MDLIKDLRAKSGAPIVDCKKALANSNNDLKLALDWLREHGAAKVSSKVRDRAATEGLVCLKVSSDNKSAAIVQVASETDFAGRSSTFVDLVTYCVDAALQSKDVNGELKVADLMKVGHESKTVEEAINEAIVSIRENLSLAYASRVVTEEGVVVGYVHGRVLPSQAGTAAALVDLAPIDSSQNVDEASLLEVGKKLAMHIVAAKPHHQDINSVPLDVVDAEREMLSKQIGDSNKPPEIVKKIVEGRLRKFFETTCLLEQSHMIEEGNPKIGKHLESLGIRLNRFDLISVA